MKKKLVIALIGLATLTLLRVATRTEITFGRVINESGDGKEYNGNDYFNYINYSGMDAHTNDVVMTVCLLNPLSQYEDDIITRHDVILLHDTPQATTRTIDMIVTETDENMATLIDTDGNLWDFEIDGSMPNKTYEITLNTLGTDDVTDDFPILIAEK